MKKSIFITFFLTIFIVINTFAQTAQEMKLSQQFEQRAIAEYKAKNFPEFLKNITEADKYRPNHSRLIYFLAIAYSLNGDKISALKNLKRLAEMGLFFQFDKNEDLKNLFDLPEFKGILDKTNRNKQPVNKSEKAFSIAQNDLIPEGIAFDARSERFFVSSIHQRKILSVDKNGKVSDFSKESDGLWSVSGMKVDEKRGILWACTTAFPQMRGFEKSLDGKSGIFKYDLKTGKLIKKYLLSNETEKHALGDLTITKNGDVFATDSVSPKIFFIDSKKDKLEGFLESDSFFSLQGLAFSPDEKYLFVADYSKGISKIETNTKKIEQIIPAENVTLLGIDGLYFYKGNLIAIQNGICLTTCEIIL